MYRKKDRVNLLGFAYIAILIFIAIISVHICLLSEWEIADTRRAKETELRFVGLQFVRAIESYYRATPLGGNQYPLTLDELVADRRFSVPIHHLRKIYLDPISGTYDWGLVISPSGGIAGVFCKSDIRPLKMRGFESRLIEFEDKERYSDWKFVFTPATASTAKPVFSG